MSEWVAAEPNQLFVILCETGEYSDREVWAETVVRTEKEAKRWVAEASEAARARDASQSLSLRQAQWMDLHPSVSYHYEAVDVGFVIKG